MCYICAKKMCEKSIKTDVFADYSEILIILFSNLIFIKIRDLQVHHFMVEYKLKNKNQIEYFVYLTNSHQLQIILTNSKSVASCSK